MNNPANASRKLVVSSIDFYNYNLQLPTTELTNLFRQNSLNFCQSADNLHTIEIGILLYSLVEKLKIRERSSRAENIFNILARVENDICIILMMKKNDLVKIYNMPICLINITA